MQVVVGGVEENEVYPGLGQHVGVLAENPLVVGGVVAEVGLSPVVGVTLTALHHAVPQSLLTALQPGGVVVGGRDLGDGGLVAVTPQEVEDTDLAVGGSAGVGGHGAVSPVGGRPGVRPYVPGGGNDAVVVQAIHGVGVLGDHQIRCGGVASRLGGVLGLTRRRLRSAVCRGISGGLYGRAVGGGVPPLAGGEGGGGQENGLKL